MSEGIVASPFTNRAMITAPADFFGRRREIERLLGRVLGGSKAQSCSIVGQRRIGKSSLLKRIEERAVAADPGVVVTLLDLQAARKLEAGEFFAKVLLRFRRAMAGAPAMVVDAHAAYDELCDLLEDDAGAHRFVVLLDEFDVVTGNPAFDEDFFGALRYMANAFDIAFVTSSYADLTDLCHTDAVRQSPFFNIFTTLDLGLMADGEVDEMLTTLVDRSSIALGEADRRLIGELGGRYPFFLQIAGSVIWEIRAEGREPGRAEVEERALAEARGHFRYFVDHLGGDERAALGALACGVAAEPDLVHRLARRSLVDPDSGGLFSPLLGAWLRDQTDRSAPTVIGRRRSADATHVLPALGADIGDRYLIERELGAGAFGKVYAARDRLLDRVVALKFLRTEGADEPAAGGRRARFLREARALAAMRHPNVITVHDVGEWEGQPWIAMELVAGGTLEDRLKAEGRLDVAEAARIASDVARGLHHAHGHGIVHRDVKPANLMLEPDGRVRIGDFGVMRYSSAVVPPTGGVITTDGRIVGTPAYMAPEQILGGDLDGRTDLFALGLVLYECLTGRQPFLATGVADLTRRVSDQAPPDPSTELPSLPAGLCAVVRRALATAPGDRWPDCEVLVRELAPYAEESPTN